ncbi:MAG TPA: hypothetical protein VGQ40_03750 [Chthoniobacterales bacterium]|jgi:hypothetical protein|nr:hypothetical protein [Chthoniobacterales bacterium]
MPSIMEQPTRSLSPETILDVWEAGRQQHELDRALTLLAAGHPQLSRDDLANLTIGERDAQLLRLRISMFGGSAGGTAECPQCNERVEFSIDARTLADAGQFAEPAREIDVNGTRVRFRLPTSRDLAEAVTATDQSCGVRRLIERCVVEPRLPEELSGDLVEALSHAMAKADPQAEIILSLGCPNCGKNWELLFDIGDFLWNEIAAQAQRLMYEIDALARAYGWTEQEILNLPARRRRTYLEMLAA